MRVLEICEPLREGVGRHVTDISVGLSHRGHEIHVAYSPLRSDDRLVERLALTKGLALVPISMRREPSYSDISALLAIRRYAFAHGPFDIVHAHSSKAGVLARLARVLGAKGDVIYTPHAFATMNASGISRTARFVYGNVERLLAPMAARIICTAADEYHHARKQLNISAGRLAMLLNGIDPDTFKRDSNLREELGLEAGTPIVGFVGRLEHQKGADIAVAALPEVLAVHPKAILVIIGDGVERARLEAQASSSGVTRAIRWLGVRPAREYFHNFDILLCPSRYDGGAYTVIEGLHSGLPVVCTAVGIAKEVIQDGVNGYLLPGPDSKEVANRVVTLLNSDDLRHAISKEALQIGDYFFVGRMLDELEAIYRAQLARRRGAWDDVGFASSPVADETAEQ